MLHGVSIYWHWDNVLMGYRGQNGVNMTWGVHFDSHAFLSPICCILAFNPGWSFFTLINTTPIIDVVMVIVTTRWVLGLEGTKEVCRLLTPQQQQKSPHPTRHPPNPPP
jgi:hypothetical protein